MTKRNKSAIELWSQLFARMAKLDGATLVNSQHDEAEDETRLRQSLALAGWSETEIEERIRIHHAQGNAAPMTSPGVNPHVEFILDVLCSDIEAAMNRLGMDTHSRLARGIEPRIGPVAGMTNIIMTDEGIITVGSFLFRFCGLVARAFTRTLHLDPDYWESMKYSDKGARHLLESNAVLADYWLRIFVSFAVTGTQVLARFRPANRREVIHFEQVARAMEIFAIAHESGHHHLRHGRNPEVDPKLEEFEADRFALRIAYEVERKPRIFPNPYLSSGAGGTILLLALKLLREFEEDVVFSSTSAQDTHPNIMARIDQFDVWGTPTVDPREYAALKGFRTASARIMIVVGALLTNLRLTIPPEYQINLREFASVCRSAS